MMRFYTKLSLISGFLLLVSIQAFSQTVTGTVYDEDGSSMPGVTVQVDNSTKGAATDLNGKYTIENAPVGEHTINFTFIGYAKLSLKVNIPPTGSVTVDGAMEQGAENLSEYVVVGYGVQRERDLNGSISKVSNKEITDIPAPSFEAGLQGKAAGVQVTTGSGLAGSASVVRIRGIASISASGDPLYVVDGIPISQDYFMNGNRGAMNNNPLATINPNDIESVEVLKDAAATGIYGSRGSNGVILVTTKTGSGKGWSYNLGTNFGVARPTKIPNMLNSSELLQLYQESWENDGNAGYAPLKGGITWDQARVTDTDWVDETIDTGFKQAYNFSANYGSDKFKAFASIGYDDNASYLVGNSYVRTSFRLNGSYKINDKLNLSANLSASQGVNNRVNSAWSGGLGEAMSTALPYYPIYYSDTVFNDAGQILHLPGDYWDQGSNPVRQQELISWSTTEWRSINNISLEYKPTKKLFVKFYAGYDYLDLKDDKYTDARLMNTDRLGTNQGLTERWATYTNNVNTNATVTYFQDINDDNQLTYLVGAEYQQSNTISKPRKYRQDSDVDGNFKEDPSLDTPYEQLTDSTFNAGYREDNDGLNNKQVFNFLSAFARVNYSLKSKYFFQASFRVDGSSRFGENNRFGFFPSASAGWVMSEENFLKDSKVVSFMKLRGSWGITGNSAIPNYQQYGEYIIESNGYNDANYRYLSIAPNPDLQWETSNTFDIGIETGFFEDRISTILSVYNKTTTDVLLNITPQVSTGFTSFWDNVGEIVNRGVEFEITSINIDRGKFIWKTNFNIAYNYNEIVNIGDYTPDAISGGTNDTRVVVGKPVGTNYLVRFSHIDPQTGRNVYLDINGNETNEWNADDRVPVGRVLPISVGGITNTFQYGNWTLGLVCIFNLGSNIYDSSSKRQLGVVTDWNMRTDIYNRWREAGDEAEYAQLSQLTENYGLDDAFNNNTTQFLKEGDYLRFRRLSLGYSFPKFAIGSANFQGADITVSAVNFLTFTNFVGLDPEIARDFENPTDRNMSPNITYLTPPQEMSFNIALNLRF